MTEPNISIETAWFALATVGAIAVVVMFALVVWVVGHWTGRLRREDDWYDDGDE